MDMLKVSQSWVYFGKLQAKLAANSLCAGLQFGMIVQTIWTPLCQLPVMLHVGYLK